MVVVGVPYERQVRAGEFAPYLDHLVAMRERGRLHRSGGRWVPGCWIRWGRTVPAGVVEVVEVVAARSQR
jgi:hypothetical protein